jgi:hypothetical protein
MLIEVQTSVPTMWQIGPQLEFILATFLSSSLYQHFFLHVLEKTPPPLSLFHKLVSLFSFCFFSTMYLQKKKKKKLVSKCI